MTTVDPSAQPADPQPRTSLVPGAEWREYPLPRGPYRLGRHLLHDPRSRDWDARGLLPRGALSPIGAAALPTQDRAWARHCVPWDQGRTNACTAFSGLGVLMTEPFYARATQRARSGYWSQIVNDRIINGVWQFSGGDCMEIYKYATRIDNSQIPGSYPPDDTGCTGVWTMKALQAYKLISSYYWAFDLATALSLLANTGPISIGTLWYESMYYPDERGVISISPGSEVVGAHQYTLDGVYPAERLVRKVGSWGGQWSLGGSAYLTWDTLERLLAEDGDVVIPTIT